MPIRFRCTSCRKLLGIARRKAGTVVKCPDCGSDLIVPTEVTTTLPARGGRRPAAGGSTPEPIPRTPPPPPKHATNGTGAAVKTPESMPLFERPDFESLLNPAVQKAAATLPPTPLGPVAVPVQEMPRPAPAPNPLTFDDDEEAYDLEPAGLVLSKATLTVMAVVVVVLIGLAFAAGYLLAAARLPAG
jgi:phage FluMu protein Com